MVRRNGTAMTNTPSMHRLAGCEILLSYGRQQDVADWLGGVADALAPAGVVCCRAHTAGDTIRRVERGGLGAAVVCGDDPQIGGLSTMRVIRSIDTDLPCWWVTAAPTRQTLQVALSLSVTSVITHPDRVDALTLALRRVFVDRVSGN